MTRSKPSLRKPQGPKLILKDIIRILIKALILTQLLS